MKRIPNYGSLETNVRRALNAVVDAIDTRLVVLEQNPVLTEVPWHSNGADAFTLTNSPNVERFALNQPTRVIKMIPLDGYTQVRLVGNQVTTSASANTPKVRLVYKTGAYSATLGDYGSLAATGNVELSLTGTGSKDSGWVTMDAGATGDVFIGLTELGGDGVADPAFGHLHVFFK